MCRLLWAAPIPGYFVSYWEPSSFTLGTCYLFNQIIMVGFGSLWTFSTGLYCFFFTLHFSVPEISLYIKSACLLPPTYKFCTYYGTKSVLSACRFFVIFTRICNFCNVFRRFLAVISFTRLCNSAVWNGFPQYGKRNALQVPASGTKIVLHILSYFCQPLQWYPILKNVTLIMT